MRIFLILLVKIALFSYPVFSLESGSNGDYRKINKQIADSLLDKGWQVLSSEPAMARSLAQKARLHISDEDIEGRITIFSLTGISYYIQANFNKASDYHLQAMELAVASAQPLYVAHAYNNLGLVNFRLGNVKDALDLYLLAISYYNDLGEERKKANTLNNIGVLYVSINNYEKALSHYDLAYEGFSLTADSIGLAAIWNNLGSLHLKQNNIDSAFFYLYKAIDQETRNQNKFGLASGYAEIAAVYYHLENYQAALENYQKSWSMATGVNNSYQQAGSLLGSASCYLVTGNTELALRDASMAMEIADQIDTDQLRLEVHDIYSKIYEKQGDTDSSLHHLRIFVDLNESILEQSKVHQIYNQEILHLSNVREIQNLHIQRQDLEISRKNNFIILIGLAFVLIIASSVLLYYNHHYRQVARHQREVTDLIGKKSRAAREAEIQERKRIGLELHDGLGQRLSLARLSISTLLQKDKLPEDSRLELMETALVSVDQAFHELRDISRNLTPSSISRAGLVQALREMAGQVNQSRHIKVRSEFIGINGHMDNLIENAMYRAAQELINNTIKHAQASEIYLQLIRDDKELTLIVEDNGKGFNEQDINLLSGGGLKGIKSKVENLGGNVFIDTFQNRGTIVTIAIPI